MEIIRYKDLVNCQTIVEKNYHEENKRLSQEHNLPNPLGRIFTYVDQDDFEHDFERNRNATTLGDRPSFLQDRMTEVRRRHGSRSVGLSRKPNTGPVNDQLTSQAKARRVIDTPFQIMYIMVNLSENMDNVASQSDADCHVICTIKTDANGILEIQPDYNSKRRPWYDITTPSGELFQFRIEHASAAPSAELAEREAQIFTDVYQKKEEILRNRVGNYFQQPREKLVQYDHVAMARSARPPARAPSWQCMHRPCTVRSAWRCRAVARSLVWSRGRARSRRRSTRCSVRSCLPGALNTTTFTWTCSLSYRRRACVGKGGHPTWYRHKYHKDRGLASATEIRTVRADLADVCLRSASRLSTGAVYTYTHSTCMPVC